MDMKVWIFLAVVVVAAISVALLKVRQTLRDVSRMAFGTDSLEEGLRMQQEQLENTPKSVAGMTRIYLPQIEKDFPEFHWHEFRERAQKSLREYLQKEGFCEIAIHKTEITEYVKHAGTCTIVVQSSAGYRKEDGVKEQGRYNTSFFYVQDYGKVKDLRGGTFGQTCPNCGAPITQLGTKHCEYCKTEVKEINIHVWTLGKIEKA